MNMNVEILSENITLIELFDRVDTFSTPAIKENFQNLFNQGAKNIIVDLSKTQFLDSSGLAVLIQLLKRSKEVGGNVKIIAPENENVQRIFQLTQFDKVFEMYSIENRDSINF